LGQYVISHMDPALRRQEERGLIEGYHKALTAQGVSIRHVCARVCITLPQSGAVLGRVRQGRCWPLAVVYPGFVADGPAQNGSIPP